ncbi:MAG: ATP-binding protein [Actinomycetota bacterium]
MQNNSDIKRFLSDLNMDNVLNVEEDLGSGFVRLKISEAERRQALQDINCVEDIVVELLRNSRDAESSNIYIGTKKLGDSKRIIHFIDDGMGIPEKFKNIIFESRVTSKLDNAKKDAYGFHGRGMALFSIKLNVEEIMITFSDLLKGTSFYVQADLDKLSEKKDQSILPQIIETGEGLTVIGGVNNIIKAIMEFQFQNPHIDIYYGTPTQILATMRSDKNDFPKFDNWHELKSFIGSNHLKVTQIPLLTDNYNILDRISKDILGMDISQRSIQRAVYGELDPLQPVTAGLEANKEEKKDNKKNKNLSLYDEIKLAGRFKPEEIKGIIDLIERELLKLGEKYFIAPSNIEYRRLNNKINIDIRLKQKD